MKSSWNETSFTILLSILIVLLGYTSGSADDVGITKARLIQEAEKRYVLEADVTQALVWAIKAPVFPDRFQVSKLEYISRAGWIVVQATTTGEPLSAQDEILLPWVRNGVALTVQWMDGSVHQGLFLRSLEGIRVPTALGLLILSIRWKSPLSGRPVLLSVAALGFLAYPFLRLPVDLPWVAEWKPSNERTSIILSGLLTNVYRAFDVRDESRVYDRLAATVVGDQLEQIYLENRKALEMENRGGAQANVDVVNVLAIRQVTPSEDDGFVADAVWTVSGSVSHFGHTHYRRNKNHARVTFVKDGNAWKIRDIELIEEKRIL